LRNAEQADAMAARRLFPRSAFRVPRSIRPVVKQHHGWPTPSSRGGRTFLGDHSPFQPRANTTA